MWHDIKDQKPPRGLVVGILDLHWKNKGWLSAELNFGEVHHYDKEEFPNAGPHYWTVQNIDDRGYGSELWIPGDNFEYWIDVSNLPPLP